MAMRGFAHKNSSTLCAPYLSTKGAGKDKADCSIVRVSAIVLSNRLMFHLCPRYYTIAVCVSSTSLTLPQILPSRLSV